MLLSPQHKILSFIQQLCCFNRDAWNLDVFSFYSKIKRLEEVFCTAGKNISEAGYHLGRCWLTGMKRVITDMLVPDPDPKNL
jgi:hypothetical protein